MENQDSVCYINKINSIEIIPNADKIELAIVNGWKSIIPKNSFKEGDIVLCITTDAVIPQEFGEKHGILNYLRTGNRVRTVKLRGVYSDCIVIPTTETKEGKDMMDKLSIFKYQEPEKIVQLAGGRRVKQKDNPNFNKYYKFPNIKNVPNIFDENDEVVITRKIHGANARYGIVKKSKLSLFDRIRRFFGNTWIDYEYVYGSHNVIKGSDTNGFYSTDVWKTVADSYDLNGELWKLAKQIGKSDLGKGIILYAEVYGPGIQGEKYTYGKTYLSLVFFDIELNGQYVDRQQFDQFTFLVDLPEAPVLYRGKYSKEIADSLVKDQFIEGTKIPHEGIVISSISGSRQKIAKVVNPDYLIFAEKYVVPENH
jgi:RNA ligase (TIGR02306 family)